VTSANTLATRRAEERTVRRVRKYGRAERMSSTGAGRLSASRAGFAFTGQTLPRERGERE
jgi:hypothetical protein